MIYEILSYLVIGFAFMLWMFRMVRHEKSLNLDGLDLFLMTLIWPWHFMLLICHLVIQGFIQGLDLIVYKIQS